MKLWASWHLVMGNDVFSWPVFFKKKKMKNQTNAATGPQRVSLNKQGSKDAAVRPGLWKVHSESTE